MNMPNEQGDSTEFHKENSAMSKFQLVQPRIMYRELAI